MGLSSKRLSLVDVRLKIFTEMEADLEAQFLELLLLRERLRQAEQTRARKPALVVIAAVAYRRQPLPAVRPALLRHAALAPRRTNSSGRAMFLGHHPPNTLPAAVCANGA
jgi:hypothetical protein